MWIQYRIGVKTFDSQSGNLGLTPAARASVGSTFHEVVRIMFSLYYLLRSTEQCPNSRDLLLCVSCYNVTLCFWASFCRNFICYTTQLYLLPVSLLHYCCLSKSWFQGKVRTQEWKILTITSVINAELKLMQKYRNSEIKTYHSPCHTPTTFTGCLYLYTFTPILLGEHPKFYSLHSKSARPVFMSTSFEDSCLLCGKSW